LFNKASIVIHMQTHTQ